MQICDPSYITEEQEKKLNFLHFNVSWLFSGIHILFSCDQFGVLVLIHNERSLSVKQHYVAYSYTLLWVILGLVVWAVRIDNRWETSGVVCWGK